MTSITDIDILKSIAENLSERKSSAALNNYLVLCNNIKYVNDLFDFGVKSLFEIQGQIDDKLKNNDSVNADFQDATKRLFYFRKIIPRILLNNISVCEKLITYTQPDKRQGITVENVAKLAKEFVDYNNLVTSARQFIDSMVADAYQLIILEPKVTNYQVLVSLNSFNKYVTKSIRHALFNDDVEKSLNEFEKLNFNQWSNSTITRCLHKTFGEKVDFIFSTLGVTTENIFKEEIKNLFKFSSEFTHIGYVSTFFTSTSDAEIVFADEVSPYLPSTENFSELKYEILGTAINFFNKIYLPALIKSISIVFEPSVSQLFENSINKIISKISDDFKTRNNRYYFFIRHGLKDSGQTIPLTCMCGVTNNWESPYDLSKIYCKNCGSEFNLIEVSGNSGYIITSNGPAKIIGSNAPDFDKLPIEKQTAILEQCRGIGRKPK